MVSISLILLLGLVSGILIGLLPGLPAYIGPLIIFPFVSHLDIDQILAYWLTTHIGSQYFGSVAAILLKIPGEASSLVYIKDLDRLNINQRLDLIRQTAWGSTVGTLTALAVMLIVYYLGFANGLLHLTSNNVKISLLLILMFVMCWSTEHKRLSFLLFFIGFFFAEKSNHELPTWIFTMQKYTTDMTLFGLILSFFIIPEFIRELGRSHNTDIVKVQKNTISKLDLKAIFKGTWIGSIVGLIPGPSHILGGIVSYNSYKKEETTKKIISAESANNSATITSLLPFLYVGLPITLSEFLLNDLLQVKMFMIPGDFKQGWHGINLIEFCFIVVLICTIIYHFLAQHFLSFYERLMSLAYGRLKYIFIGLIVYLVYIDLKFNPVYIIPYVSLMIILTWIGHRMSCKGVNALPLIFGYILGDMLAWSLYHFYQLNLS